MWCAGWESKTVEGLDKVNEQLLGFACCRAQEQGDIQQSKSISEPINPCSFLFRVAVGGSQAGNSARSERGLDFYRYWGHSEAEQFRLIVFFSGISRCMWQGWSHSLAN